MKDPIEMKGVWWLPDDADNELPGTLSFSQDDGAMLEVVGVFGIERSDKIEQPEIILGLTQQGKPVTLYKCSYKNWRFPLVGLGGGEYRVRFIFEGVHFKSESEIRFNQLRGSYTDLDNWVGISGFFIDENFIDNKYIANIRFEQPSAQFFDVDNEFEAGISFAFKGPSRNTVNTEATISQHAYLLVKNKTDDVSFDVLFSRLNTFSYLVQIAAQRMIYPLKIFGYVKENIQQEVGQSAYSPEINIYYAPVEPMISQKSKLPQEMLFTFKDLDPDQIKKWFAVFDEYQTIVHLYRSLFYSNRLFIETRFLNIAQALESLHSLRFGSLEFPKSEFDAKKKKVLDSTPEELRDWVKRALNNANYKSFASRISELLKEKSEYFLGLIDDIDLFAKRVRDTRNEFVHHGKLRWTFHNGKELVDAINWLTFLFEIYLLDSIGFSDEKVQELTKPKKQGFVTGWKHMRTNTEKK